MEPSSAPSSPGIHPQRSDSESSQSRRPLPKYTTIDLENELPELYSTSLNPNLHDPDLTMFYNQTGPPFYNYKRSSPLPSYPASMTTSRTVPSVKEKYQERTKRYKRMLVAFFICFVVFPFFLLLLTSLLPALHTLQTVVVE